MHAAPIDTAAVRVLVNSTAEYQLAPEVASWAHPT
jgi:hypothetical protein